MVIIKYRKFLIFSPRQINIKIQQEINTSINETNNIPDNKNTLEEYFIEELTNKLHSILP